MQLYSLNTTFTVDSWCQEINLVALFWLNHNSNKIFIAIYLTAKFKLNSSVCVWNKWLSDAVSVTWCYRQESGLTGGSAFHEDKLPVSSISDTGRVRHSRRDCLQCRPLLQLRRPPVYTHLQWRCHGDYVTWCFHGNSEDHHKFGISLCFQKQPPGGHSTRVLWLAWNPWQVGGRRLWGKSEFMYRYLSVSVRILHCYLVSLATWMCSSRINIRKHCFE